MQNIDWRWLFNFWTLKQKWVKCVNRDWYNYLTHCDFLDDLIVARGYNNTIMILWCKANNAINAKSADYFICIIAFRELGDRTKISFKHELHHKCNKVGFTEEQKGKMYAIIRTSGTGYWYRRFENGPPHFTMWSWLLFGTAIIDCKNVVSSQF